MTGSRAGAAEISRRKVRSDMITYEAIREANGRLPRMDIKGKRYSTVAVRLQAYREMCAGGAITTEIVHFDPESVMIRATVTDEDGKVLATGTAYEERGSSFINKTSFVENAETSAIGRALAVIGIGSEEQMCSADELANALKNQKDTPPASSRKEEAQTRAEIARIVGSFPASNLMLQICSRYHVDSLSELTGADAAKCLKLLKKYEQEHAA